MEVLLEINVLVIRDISSIKAKYTISEVVDIYSY